MRSNQKHEIPGLAVHVVEPHGLAAHGLRTILKSFRNVRFHRAIPRALPGSGPQVIIADTGTLAEPPGELFRLARDRNPQALVIVAEAQASAERMIELLILGAVGFVTYEAAPRELSESLHAVAQGRLWFPADILHQFAGKKNALTSGLHLRLLTKREATILGLLERGFCNKEVATTLRVSVSTVKFHVKNIFAKLDVHGRAAAVREGRRRGISLTLVPKAG